MLKRNKISTFLFIFAIYTLPFLSTQPTKISLANAENLEKQGKTEQALIIYEEWLKINKNDPQVYNILNRISELEKNPFRILDIFIEYTPAVKDPYKKSKLYKEIALLWEMLGRIESALDYYKLAYKDLKYSDKDVSLLNLAKLFIEQGLLIEAENWIKMIINQIKDKEILAESYYLLAEIYTSLNKLSIAHSYLILIKNQYPHTYTYPKCLLHLLQIYIINSNKEKIELIFSELEEKYTNTPEYELALSLINKNKTGYTFFLPSPHRLIGTEDILTSDTNKKVDDNKAHTEEPESEETQLVFIQVGSYTMRENAEYMVKELIEKGFEARIVNKKISGTLYYRVVVGKPSSEDKAQILMLKLKGEGYEGYLISAEL